MNDELIVGLPMADYLAIEAASSSGIKTLATQSPLKYREASKDSTPSQTLGTLAHLAIMEPSEFAKVAVMPSGISMATNAGKDVMVQWLIGLVGEPTVFLPPKTATGKALNAYLAELRPRLADSGIPTASAEDWGLACSMRDALMGRSDTRAVLEQAGESEVSGLCTDADYSVPCKIRPDRLSADMQIIVSLKTCQSVGELDYLRTARTYGYPGAAWFYSRCMQEITSDAYLYLEIAVESAAPHDAMVVEYTDREIADGEKTMRKGLETYQKCLESGIWPGACFDWDRMDYSIARIGR